MLDDLVAVLRVCQAHDDPRTALPGVCQLLQGRLQCSAVLVAGVTTHGTMALARLGHDDLTAAAQRSADLGQTATTCESGATDCAVTVRLGDAVVGALACRWAMPESRLDPPIARCSRRRPSPWRRRCALPSSSLAGRSSDPRRRACSVSAGPLLMCALR